LAFFFVTAHPVFLLVAVFFAAGATRGAAGAGVAGTTTGAAAGGGSGTIRALAITSA
jgi:hypothetical protein